MNMYIMEIYYEVYLNVGKYVEVRSDKDVKNERKNPLL